MKTRSPSFPSKNLPDAKNFSVSVFEHVGETALSYKELGKHGGVAVRDADNFAVSSSQYGFMKQERGKGYAAIGQICSALRLPKDGEENALYLNAFTSPSIYKTIIGLFNGKKITENGLIIDLVRDHQFRDPGAKIAAKVFLENAKFLGLLNEDGILNVDADIKIEPLPAKEKKSKSNPKNSNDKKNNSSKPKVKPEAAPVEQPHPSGFSGHNGTTRKIPIFIRGQELHFHVLENMNQNDWDHVIKQLQTIKTFSK